MIESDINQAERLYKIANHLRNGKMTIGQLVQVIYGVPNNRSSNTWKACEKNIARSIELLRDLEPDYKNLGGRPAKHIISTQRSKLHPIHQIALYSAARLLYHSASEQTHYLRALHQLEKWMPDNIKPVLERSRKDLGRRNSKESTALEKVASAWFELRPFQFEYRSATGSGTWRTYCLETWFIEIHPANHDLYAVGFESGFHNKTRLFKLARMRNIQVLTNNAHYSIPEDFDPREYFYGAWGVVGKSDGETVTIKLRFSPEVKNRLEEGGYPNMKMQTRSDGYTDVLIQAGKDSRTGLSLEVLVWVRSWAASVEVLEPPELRERWLEDARELMERYGGETRKPE